MSKSSDRLAGWARRYLRPEGPLPPIRIDQQPYALLPTSALSQWKVSGEEGPLAQFEERVNPAMTTMRAHWAAAARGHGTAVGADTQHLLDLIARDAVSASYAYRPFLATQLWASLYTSIGGFDQRAYDDWIRATFQPVYDLLQRGPERPPGIRDYAAFDTYDDLALPLVVPNQWPRSFYAVDVGGSLVLDEHGGPVRTKSAEQSLVQLFETLMAFGFRYDLVMEQWRGALPDSLLVRLLLHAGVLSAAAVVQTNAGPPAPLRELLVGDTAVQTLLEFSEPAVQSRFFARSSRRRGSRGYRRWPRAFDEARRQRTRDQRPAEAGGTGISSDARCRDVSHRSVDRGHGGPPARVLAE